MNYNRFISYIYAYEKGEKGKNVGFAKMEERAGRCRISMSLKGAGAAGERLDVYGICRADLEKVRLGEVTLRGGQGEFSCMTEQTRIGGRDCRLSDLCGLYVAGPGAGTVLFSGWDETVKSVADLQTSPRKETQAAEKAEETAEAVPEVQVQAVNTPITQRDAEAARQQAVFAAPERNAALALSARAETPKTTEQALWKLWCKIFPKRLPAPGGENWQLLELQLQDIGRLPRKNWIYGNNSFVVQGFYRYRHLVLGRRMEAGAAHFWLGVPGSAGESERLLAGMFGFREYLPAGNRAGAEWGYWCVEIEMDADL